MISPLQVAVASGAKDLLVKLTSKEDEKPLAARWVVFGGILGRLPTSCCFASASSTNHKNTAFMASQPSRSGYVRHRPQGADLEASLSAGLMSPGSILDMSDECL